MIYILVPTTAERAPRLEVLKESLRQFAGVPYVLCTYENYREGFIGPIQKLLSGLKDDTLVWCIGDDTKLVEVDTLKRLVDKFKPGLVVQPDDGIQHDSIVTMPLTDAKTMRDGTFEGYFLNYADLEFTLILKALNRFVYCGDVKVEHSHWRNGKATRDETYTFADEMCAKDAALFEERKKISFNNNRLLNGK